MREPARQKLSLALLFSVLLVSLPNQSSSESSAISSTLPIEVQVDLLMTELSNLLREDNNQGIIELIPRIRALDIQIPDSLNFLEARALFRTGKALAARDRLLAYLGGTGREGKYYQQASELLLKVKKEAAIQEQRMAKESAQEEERQRQSALKAQILKTRESQRYLHALGFPLEDTGEMTKATREAIAVYQVRQGLEVNGLVTNELLGRLRAAVPDTHTCDSLAAYSTGADNWGIAISAIPANAAIPACNDALRKYPDTIRFQVQYARALVAAGRDKDAMDAIEGAARLGYPEAEFLIGYMHERGMLAQNGKPDYTNAVRWYTMSSNRGYPEALRKMGVLYEKGLGVRREAGTAVEFYHKAASQGFAPAQVDLGLIFTKGLGVKRNHVTAIEWFTKAADAGYPRGQFYLGDMFEKGRGVKRDKSTAVSWYRKASNQGLQEATSRIKRLGK